MVVDFVFVVLALGAAVFMEISTVPSSAKDDCTGMIFLSCFALWSTILVFGAPKPPGLGASWAFFGLDLAVVVGGFWALRIVDSLAASESWS